MHFILTFSVNEIPDKKCYDKQNDETDDHEMKVQNVELFGVDAIVRLGQNRRR